MHTLSLIVKGIIIGIANIIPGVSGGTLAVSLGIYDKVIASIYNIFFKKNERNKAFYYLLKLAIGATIGIFLFSKVVLYLLDNHNSLTMAFFIGLILGGLRTVFSAELDMSFSIKRLTAFCIGLAAVLFLGRIPSLLGVGQAPVFNAGIGGYIYVLFCGIAAGGTMILPGVSGAMVLMVLGVYRPMQEAIANLAILPISALCIGAGIGVITFSFIIKHLLERWPAGVRWFLAGLVIGSVLLILPPIPQSATGWLAMAAVLAVGLAVAVAVERALR